MPVTSRGQVYWLVSFCSCLAFVRRSSARAGPGPEHANHTRNSALHERSRRLAQIHSICARFWSPCPKVRTCTITWVAPCTPNHGFARPRRTAFASIWRRRLCVRSSDPAAMPLMLSSTVRQRKSSRIRCLQGSAPVRCSGRRLFDARLRADAWRDRARPFLRHIRPIWRQMTPTSATPANGSTRSPLAPRRRTSSTWN